MRIAVRRPAGSSRELVFDAAIVAALTALYEFHAWGRGRLTGYAF
jgi:hypothetical protein